MNTWLHIRYFFIAVGLMAIVQVEKFINEEISITESILAILLGGLFWGVIATFISKKLGKRD